MPSTPSRAFGAWSRPGASSRAPAPPSNRYFVAGVVVDAETSQPIAQASVFFEGSDENAVLTHADASAGVPMETATRCELTAAPRVATIDGEVRDAASTQFLFDSAEIQPDSESILEEMAEVLPTTSARRTTTCDSAKTERRQRAKRWYGSGSTRVV
jgi:outer membrane protein OmpA-like peptidoglycan-associated protein